MSTKLSSDKLTTCEHATGQRLQFWLVDELTILAEALGETVTPERLRIYARDLASDLSCEQLQVALTRARRELRFFPKISELRELAGISGTAQQQVEAEAAWQFVHEYLRRWGVDLMPEYIGAGKWRNAPALPSRTEYAVRRIGGLRGLNQITEQSRPFMFKDFCEAYQQAPLADLMTKRLEAMFGDHKLLAAAQPEQVTSEKKRTIPDIHDAGKPVLKRIPEPLTDAQLQDRRALLRQQAEQIQNRNDHEQRTAGTS